MSTAAWIAALVVVAWFAACLGLLVGALVRAARDDAWDDNGAVPAQPSIPPPHMRARGGRGMPASEMLRWTELLKRERRNSAILRSQRDQLRKYYQERFSGDADADTMPRARAVT